MGRVVGARKAGNQGTWYRFSEYPRRPLFPIPHYEPTARLTTLTPFGALRFLQIGPLELSLRNKLLCEALVRDEAVAGLTQGH